jgi:hypothetical protein
MLHFRTGHQLDHNLPMSVNHRLGEVVHVVCTPDPDNGHPDMIAPANRLGALDKVLIGHRLIVDFVRGGRFRH